MKAIKETGNNLIAAFDPVDSVGIIDSYFPNADFFTEFERFDRYVDKLRRLDNAIDFVSVCSPNYLHDAHVRFGLRSGADVICEKPVVLNPWNVAALSEIERDSGQKIFNILQLRNHASILALKKEIEEGSPDKIYDVDLTYQTSRGNWYYASWKGDQEKSGGIATNIGVHFFDMLTWIFGAKKNNVVHVHSHDRAAGYLELEQARVQWFLSINEETLPEPIRKRGQRTNRLIEIDGKAIDFSDGFTDLHTDAYRQILAGKGYRLADVWPSIDLVHEIRTAEPIGLTGNHHPMAELPLSQHPFRN